MTQGNGASAQQPLKRRLTLPLLVLYGLGVTVGAGIYVLVGAVAGKAGIYAPLSFLIAALVTACSALSFAELAVRYPESAGEAVYVEEGFGIPALALATGLAVVFAGLLSAATVSLGAAAYLAEIIDLPQSLGMIAIVVLLGAFAARGIIESVAIAGLLTVIEIGGLILICVGAIVVDPHLPAKAAQMWVMPDRLAIGGILSAAVVAFFAFIGFEDMVNVVEEVKSPSRTIPAAIIITLIATTILYLGVSVIAIATVGADQLAATDAPLAAVAGKSGIITPQVLSAIAVLAGINGILVQIIMASRILYGLARRHRLPGWFGVVGARTATPVNATLSVTVIIILLALAFPLARLATGTSIITLTVFSLVNVALIAIKRRNPSYRPEFQVPMAVPVIGCTVSLMLLMFEFLF